MSAAGSRQQQEYLRLRAAGATMMTACVQSGLFVSVARALEAQPSSAPVVAHPQENDDMPRGRKPKAISGEVPKPDFAAGVRIYREDIKPAKARQAEHGQEMSTAYKEIKNHANLHPGAAKVAFTLDGMEESKRDDWLRTFRGLLQALRIFMPSDLVDQAEGKGEANENVVPIGDRPAPQLATIPGDDSDLAGGDDDDAGDADPAIAAE